MPKNTTKLDFMTFGYFFLGGAKLRNIAKKNINKKRKRKSHTQKQMLSMMIMVTLTMMRQQFVSVPCRIRPHSFSLSLKACLSSLDSKQWRYQKHIAHSLRRLEFSGQVYCNNKRKQAGQVYGNNFNIIYIQSLRYGHIVSGFIFIIVYLSFI